MAVDELVKTLSHARRSGATVHLATTGGTVDGVVWSVDPRRSQTVWVVDGPEPVAEDRFVPLRSIIDMTTTAAG
jgi:hypothetical protein